MKKVINSFDSRPENLVSIILINFSMWPKWKGLPNPILKKVVANASFPYIAKKVLYKL